MNRVTPQDLQTLWNDPSHPCISIYLPTHRAGSGTEADRIVLKNLTRQAQARLEAMGRRETEVRALLEPMEALLADQPAWKEQDAGLAVMRSPNRFSLYHLEQAPPERVVVGERFHVRPLLPSLGARRPFHVLALSLNAVRLLHADARAVSAAPLAGAPENLADFRRFEDAQPDAQYRQGGEGGTFRGGGRQADAKDEQRRYVKAVAKAVARHLQECPAPLVFAGVEELFAFYREAGSGNHLLPAAISGNPERLSAEALRDLAIELVRPLQEAERARAAADYRQLQRSGRALTGLPQVLRAASAGRVATLMTRPDAECWGHYSPSDDKVVMHKRAQPGDDELLDLAVSLTLRAGGRWMPLPDELAGSPTLRDSVAAVLRY